MTITISAEVAEAIKAQALRHGTTPESLALSALRDRFVAPPPHREPRDEWERLVLAAGTDCGTSVPNWALSSDGLYD